MIPKHIKISHKNSFLFYGHPCSDPPQKTQKLDTKKYSRIKKQFYFYFSNKPFKKLRRASPKVGIPEPLFPIIFALPNITCGGTLLLYHSIPSLFGLSSGNSADQKLPLNIGDFLLFTGKFLISLPYQYLEEHDRPKHSK